MGNVIGDGATNAPTGPGVYFLLGGRAELIYVGKATNLRQRLRQHAKAAAERSTPRDALRLEMVAEVRWEETGTEAAAASREADLIVAFGPVLNAAIATEGRWVYVVLEPDGGNSVRLTLQAEPSGRQVYGCFPHLGVGMSSRPGIACSEGYAALIRLLWAAGTADERVRCPRQIAGSSPPSSVTTQFEPSRLPSLKKLFTGTSWRIVDELFAQTGDRPSYERPALRRDRDAAIGFYEYGPRALRSLRLRHGRAAGPISRTQLTELLVADLRQSIGHFELPALDDPTSGLLGQRTGRAAATQSALRRRSR